MGACTVVVSHTKSHPYIEYFFHKVHVIPQHALVAAAECFVAECDDGGHLRKVPMAFVVFARCKLNDRSLQNLMSELNLGPVMHERGGDLLRVSEDCVVQRALHYESRV
jgi:hypothetical protein